MSLNGCLLDADHSRLYVGGDSKVVARVNARLDAVLMSTVTAEEVIVGRLSVINRVRNGKASLPIALAHEEFAESLDDLRVFQMLTYSSEADQVFRTFTPAQRRVGGQDCRLAAQALAHSMTVVTRNVRDFDAIGAPCEDWSR